MAGEIAQGMSIDWAANRFATTDSKNLVEYTETDLLKAGAELFHRRDEIEKSLRDLDKEIKKLSDAFSVKSRMWGFTPMMFRKEMRLRGLA